MDKKLVNDPKNPEDVKWTILASGDATVKKYEKLIVDDFKNSRNWKARNPLEDCKELDMDDPADLFVMNYALLYKYLKSHRNINVSIKNGIVANPDMPIMQLIHNMTIELAGRFNKMKKEKE